ncbi:unnamed protein product (macronuclear) [Paramecium tetraurelia]|uniref:Myb/SANT-like domain-containing protein n=1 Tax=Paramecium tetraurelia TaxID=5888 RepID=A0E6B3_PARTE|nr:uncharacterized protein GSPATT00003695001 [Paramecium tetraurelia]CAK90830.1 unnamed protein product [Paramecium tetraurelia]|eukprot:XP_001458227.1 hypothetical protein (macronuclear) [Paramecium tetraurelia strain d4-2]
MSNRNQYNEEIQRKLIEIVDTYGGKKCKSWTQVARIFELQTGIKVQKTFDLKKKWEMFTNYKEDLTKSELKALYATGVRCRGHHKAGNEEFFKQTGKKLYVNQYRKLVGNFLLAAIKLLSQSYVNPKKVKCRQSGQERFHNRIGYVSIHILLRAVEINKYLDDYLVQELKRSAEKFQQLLLIHAEHHEDERIARFSHYHKVINRREFKKIQFFLDYVNELKQISINLYSDQVGRHPLLFPQIDQNKQSKIYELLIWGNDWQSKYNLFQECAAKSDWEEYSMLIKKTKKNDDNKQTKNKSQQPQQQSSQIINPDSLEPETSKLKLNSYDLVSTATHKVCNNASKQQIKQLDKQELKSFRGHYYRDGQIRTKGLTTILFDTDMRSDEDDQDQCQNIEENRKEFFDKMEEIYDCVFGGKASLVSFEKSLQFPN